VFKEVVEEDKEKKKKFTKGQRTKRPRPSL
jgi:hypothetical protein